jgi:WD40 repeat protein
MHDERRTWDDGPPESNAQPHTCPNARYSPTGLLLGQGGLGRVDLVHDHTLERDIARKQLHADGSALRERFLREARITAQLEHPGIVPVYELGYDADRRPYYTMRRIHGQTLAAVLAACRTERDRLALLPGFADACQAVAYAHAQGVVHRDLKPENMMIGPFGESIVVDWGLARAAGSRDPVEAEPAPSPAGGDSQGTMLGQAIGTPAYMSPEQARGEPVDPRSDVWSLGVILYEILSGKPMLSGVPARMIEQLQAHRLPPPTAALDGAPAELIAIVERALEPFAKQRYADAGAFAADLVRWQNGGLVDAYRYSFPELVRRTVQRHRSIAGIFAMVVVSASLVALVGALAVQQIRLERDRAIHAEQLANDREREATGRLARSMASAAKTAFSRQDRLTARVMALGSLALAPSAEARGTLVASQSAQPELAGALHLKEPCELPVLASDASVGCWTRDGLTLWPKLIAAPESVTIPGAVGSPWAVDSSPSGRRFVAVHYDGNAYVTERGAATAPRHLDASEVNTAAFLDEQRVVVAAGDAIVVFDLDTGARTTSRHHAMTRFDDFTQLADGRVLVGSVTDPIALWTPKTDAWHELAGRPVAPMLAASENGSVIAYSGGWGGSATPLWLRVGDDARQLDGARARTALGMSDDGTRLMAVSEDTLTIWDGPDWEVRAVIPADTWIAGASMNAAGTLVVVSESDGDLRLWRLPPRATPQPRDTRGTIWDVDASSDGALLVSAGNDGVLRVSDGVTGTLLRARALDPGGLGFTTTLGRDAVIATNTNGIQRIGLDDLAVRWTLPVDWVTNDVQPTADGDLIFATNTGDVARVSGDGRALWSTHLASWVNSVAVEATGSILAIGQEEVIRLDAADGHVVQRWPAETAQAVIADPAGGAFTGAMGHLTHLDRDGRTIARMEGGHQTRVQVVGVGGGLLASGDDNGEVCLWDLTHPTPKACWRAHLGAVWSTIFVPGAPRLATGGSDGATRLWDLSALDADPQALLADAAKRYGLAPGDGHIVEVSP